MIGFFASFPESRELQNWPRLATSSDGKPKSPNLDVFGDAM